MSFVCPAKRENKTTATMATQHIIATSPLHWRYTTTMLQCCTQRTNHPPTAHAKQQPIQYNDGARLACVSLCCSHTHVIVVARRGHTFECKRSDRSSTNRTLSDEPHAASTNYPFRAVVVCVVVRSVYCLWLVRHEGACLARDKTM